MLLVAQRGHVPRTTGATGAPGEQAFAIAAADRVRHHVERLGHQVRIIDADPPASAYRGDAFLAVHYDSSANPSVRGASVGYQTPEGADLASRWKAHYVAHGWSGGFRADNYTAALGGYYGVRRAVSVGNRRAFIAEAGFHSNPGDAELLAAPSGPERVAVAVAACFGRPVNPAQPVEEDDMPTIHETRGLLDEVADDLAKRTATLRLVREQRPDGYDALWILDSASATRHFVADWYEASRRVAIGGIFCEDGGPENQYGLEPAIFGADVLQYYSNVGWPADAHAAPD